MLNGDIANLAYRVVFASSYSRKNSPDNMCTSSAYGEGWLSAPNPLFPQVIVLDFHRNVCAEEIRVISHQYAIPTEILFETAPDVHVWNQSKYSQIAKTPFSDNRERQYKAREMRSATLPKLHFRFLKLTIPSAHQNQRNEANQVGVVSLTVTGAYDNIFDDSEIQRLSDEKRIAIDAEDYLLAHKLSGQLEAYKANKAKIDDLKKKKDEAAAREDFTLAARLKNEIIRLTNIKPVVQKDLPQRQSYEYSPSEDQDAVVIPQPRVQRTPPSPQHSAYQDSQEPTFVDQYSEISNKPSSRRTRNEFNSELDEYDDLRRMPTFAAETREIRPMRDVNLLENDENDDREEMLEELSPEAQEEAVVLIDSLGEEPIRYYYSKSITNRAKGIEMITDAICSIPKMKRQNLYIRFMYILKLENAPQYFSAALNSIMVLTDQSNPSREARHTSIDRFIPLIVDRISVDSGANRRTNEQCQRFLIWAASEEVVGIQIVIENLVKIPRKKTASANMPVKLRIILDLLTQFGDPQLDYIQICQYTSIAIESPNADVRGTVQAIYGLILEIAGKGPIERCFTTKDKPKMIMNILKKAR